MCECVWLCVSVCECVQYHILLCYLTSAVKFSAGARWDRKSTWLIELSSDLVCACIGQYKLYAK